MQAQNAAGPTAVGTRFFGFYHAYCLMMHMLGNLFVGQIAIKKQESCSGSVVDKHRDSLVYIEFALFKRLQSLCIRGQQ